MFEQLKDAVCRANRELARRGLVTLTWGNASGISPDPVSQANTAVATLRANSSGSPDPTTAAIRPGRGVPDSTGLDDAPGSGSRSWGGLVSGPRIRP